MWPIQVTSQQLLLQGGLRSPRRTLQTVWFSFRTGRLCHLRQDRVLMLTPVLWSVWTFIIECLVTWESSQPDGSSQFVRPHLPPPRPGQSWLVTQSFSRSFQPNILRFRNSQQPFSLTRLLPNQWERLRPELERERGKRVSKRTEQVRDGDRWEGGKKRQRDKSGLPYLSFSVCPCHGSYTTVQAFFQEIFLLPKKVLLGSVSCNYGLVVPVFPCAVIENPNQIFGQANKRILNKI